jgi:hypothetical protein
VISNPFYLEELNAQKVKNQGKRTSSEFLKANWGSRPQEYSLKSVTAYSLSLAENGAVKKDLEKYRSL